MAGTNGDALLVEDRADVVRMDALDSEGENAGLLSRRADNGHPGNIGQTRGRIFEKLVFIFRRGHEIDRIDIVYCSPKPNTCSNCGCPGLEFLGYRRKCRSLKAHTSYHAATGLVWRHLVEPFAFAIDNPASCRSEHLVAGERKKVAIEILHVDRKMRDALRGVDANGHAE